MFKLNGQSNKCFHCGDECRVIIQNQSGKSFCCDGCKMVYEILAENNLCTYYDLDQKPGISLKAKNYDGKFEFLSSDAILDELLDAKLENIHALTLYIPSIHCSSCIWLLEHLDKLVPGLKESKVNFVYKQISLKYSPSDVSLQKIVEILATIGYEPVFTALNNDLKSSQAPDRRLVLKIAIVGFCMGNTMIFSFPEYLGISESHDIFKFTFLYLNLILSFGVVFYGASDYIKGAYTSAKAFLKSRQNTLSIDIPITLGVGALFLKSVLDAIFYQKAGYFDSLSGLVFLLLIGKWLQIRTFNFLSFRLEYQSFFPLAVRRIFPKTDFVNIKNIQKGDVLSLTNGEVIPADGILISKNSTVDYAFITGEADLNSVNLGEKILAGGRVVGQRIVLKVEKPISVAYFTQLWNNQNLKISKPVKIDLLSHLFSKYFTIFAILIAFFTGTFWWIKDPNFMWQTSVAVLMVACPCALSLAMPFAMHTAMTILAKKGFYVKNQSVINRMTSIDTIVFDKTGTLTIANEAMVKYTGSYLNNEKSGQICCILQNSNHPNAKSIVSSLSCTDEFDVHDFNEVAGLGVEASIGTYTYKIGSGVFVNYNGPKTSGTKVHISINQVYYGYFLIEQPFRKGWKEVLSSLKLKFDLILLSGDHKMENASFKKVFNEVLFEKEPQAKMKYIEEKELTGHKTMMIGDGLNDAGALMRASVGIALKHQNQSFTPASDVIMDADRFDEIPAFIAFAKGSLKMVKISFLLSLLYNAIGISWAISGTLSPIKAAIFMPLSSISVVLFSVLLTYWQAYKLKLI